MTWKHIIGSGPCDPEGVHETMLPLSASRVLEDYYEHFKRVAADDPDGQRRSTASGITYLSQYYLSIPNQDWLEGVLAYKLAVLEGLGRFEQLNCMWLYSACGKGGAIAQHSHGSARYGVILWVCGEQGNGGELVIDGEHVVPFEPGKLLLFPSFRTHEVREYKGDGLRLSLVANIYSTPPINEGRWVHQESHGPHGSPQT